MKSRPAGVSAYGHASSGPRRQLHANSWSDDEEGDISCLARLPGAAFVLHATHVLPTVINDHPAFAMEEQLVTVNARGAPKAVLHLKVGCLVTCLADLPPREVLHVGALLRVLSVKTLLMTVETVPSIPHELPIRAMVPRIRFDLKSGKIPFGRLQFPFRLADVPQASPKPAEPGPLPAVSKHRRSEPAAARGSDALSLNLRKTSQASAAARTGASAAPVAATGAATETGAAAASGASAVTMPPGRGPRSTSVADRSGPTGKAARPASRVISLISDDEGDTSPLQGTGSARAAALPARAALPVSNIAPQKPSR